MGSEMCIRDRYGPHAMIVFLGFASVLTGSILGLAMIDPLISAGASILLVGALLIAKFRFSGR